MRFSMRMKWSTVFCMGKADLQGCLSFSMRMKSADRTFREGEYRVLAVPVRHRVHFLFAGASAVHLFAYHECLCDRGCSLSWPCSPVCRACRASCRGGNDLWFPAFVRPHVPACQSVRYRSVFPLHVPRDLLRRPVVPPHMLQRIPHDYTVLAAVPCDAPAPRHGHSAGFIPQVLPASGLVAPEFAREGRLVYAR